MLPLLGRGPSSRDPQRSPFLISLQNRNYNVRAALGKEGALKDLTKEKPPTSPAKDAPSRLMAGSTAEVGALARLESREERRRIWD